MVCASIVVKGSSNLAQAERPAAEAARKTPAAAARRRALQWRVTEPCQPNSGNGRNDTRPAFTVKPPKWADFTPETHGNEIDDRKREGPVEIRLLRQVCNIFTVHRAEAYPTFQGRERAGNPFEKGRFAGAIGADDGCQATHGNLSLAFWNCRSRSQPSGSTC